MLSTWLIISDVNLDHQAYVVRSLIEIKVKITFLPFHTLLFGRKSCKPIVKELGVSTYII